MEYRIQILDLKSCLWRPLAFVSLDNYSTYLNFSFFTFRDASGIGG